MSSLAIPLVVESYLFAILNNILDYDIYDILGRSAYDIL